MSKKIFRIHTFESVFVGPKEPNTTFPPNETHQMPERALEWTFEELPAGILITQKNPRATTRDVSDGRGAMKKQPTPNGQVWRTLVPWPNVRDVQYEEEVVTAPRVKVIDAPSKGAA